MPSVESHQLLLESQQHLLTTEVLHSIAPSILSEECSQPWIGGKIPRCGQERVRISGRDHAAERVSRRITLNDVSQHGAGVRGGQNWAARGEHAREFGRHHQIGGSCALRQQMDVRSVEKLRKTACRLQRKQGYIAQIADQKLQLWSERSVPTENEVNGGICSQTGRQGRKQLKALFIPHVSRVKKHGLGTEAQFRPEARVDPVREWLDGLRVHPVRKENSTRGWDPFEGGAFDHARRDR